MVRDRTPEWTAHIEAMAELLGLPVDQASRVRIANAFAIAAKFAALVTEFPLDEVSDEPAPVFRPGQP